jgi:hypothetical protein
MPVVFVAVFSKKKTAQSGGSEKGQNGICQSTLTPV